MEIALMRSNITIQKSMITADAIGNHTANWADYYVCSAYANHRSGKEYFAAGQTIDEDIVVFTVRYCARTMAVNTVEYRILFAGEIYNITDIDDYQFRHETLKLTAQRVRR